MGHKKGRQNYAHHGIKFEMAREVFNDPLAVEWLDERELYGEDRWVIIGMVENRLLYLAYTIRGDKIRIISDRGAEPYEKSKYHEEND